MNLERYEFITTNNFQDYVFYSEGPNGRIKKVISYTLVENDPVTFNLAFGDEDEKGIVRDRVISNNLDTEKILATVAITIDKFCDHYGNHFIYIEGSTPARTRLYQIGIARIWEEIRNDYNLWGYKDEAWHHFLLNVNYEAFLVSRK